MAAKLQARQFHFALDIHGEGAGEVIMKSRKNRAVRAITRIAPARVTNDSELPEIPAMFFDN